MLEDDIKEELGPPELNAPKVSADADLLKFPCPTSTEDSFWNELLPPLLLLPVGLVLLRHNRADNGLVLLEESSEIFALPPEKDGKNSSNQWFQIFMLYQSNSTLKMFREIDG